MPTELFDADGERLRSIGSEFGTTTGRPRRCGWFDAVVVEASTRANAFTDIFLTKLDILTGWEKIPVCVAYDVDGVRHDTLPISQVEFSRAKPVYEELDGWDEDISSCRTLEELPKATRAYVQRLEDLCGTRISGIGVGPSREQSIVINDLI
jgi:adenylosuccinate synthase